MGWTFGDDEGEGKVAAIGLLVGKWGMGAGLGIKPCGMRDVDLRREK